MQQVYPWPQYPFALLYFTGSAYFNRSMRLYAKRAHSMCLSDHGLHPARYVRVVDSVPGANSAAAARAAKLYGGASTRHQVRAGG